MSGSHEIDTQPKSKSQTDEAKKHLAAQQQIEAQQKMRAIWKSTLKRLEWKEEVNEEGGGGGVKKKQLGILIIILDER